MLAGQSIDSHLAIVQSNGPVQYGLSDAINSTVATVDQVGAVKSQFFYEPFGQTTTTGSYPFQYTGRLPTANGLYYNRARFYNSQTGRFIKEDPIGFAGGGMNLYRYVSNSPTSFSDPFGLRQREVYLTLERRSQNGDDSGEDLVSTAFLVSSFLPVASEVGTVIAATQLTYDLYPRSGAVQCKLAPKADRITLAADVIGMSLAVFDFPVSAAILATADFLRTHPIILHDFLSASYVLSGAF